MTRNYLWPMLLLLMFLLAGLVGGPGHRTDLAIMQLMSDARGSAPDLVQVAGVVTILGGAAFTLPLAGIVAILLLLKSERRRAFLLVAIVLAERVLVHGLKEWVGRPRPSDGEFSIGSMAFPSGHAANSMTVYLAIAILAAPAPYRRSAVIGAVVLSVIVGMTRIFLGVHWPSDVIGGWALGIATVVAAVEAARRSIALPLEAKHQVVGGHRDSTGEDKTS